MSPKEKLLLSYQTSDPPPTLRSLEEPSANPNVGSLLSSHALVVDQVSEALNPSSSAMKSE